MIAWKGGQTEQRTARRSADLFDKRPHFLLRTAQFDTLPDEDERSFRRVDECGSLFERIFRRRGTGT